MEKKSFVTFVILICIAVVLRFYRIDENFIFNGEIGYNLLAIKNAYLNIQLPLLGPPTSHPWLSFGPFFYWIYGPILFFSNFNPLSHAYFGAAISVLIVISNFLFTKALFNSRVAVISTYLIAISPLFLEFSRNARFFAIVSLLIYPFLYFLYKLSICDSKKFIIFGFIFGSMFSFHFTPLMLIPFIITVFLIKKIKLVKKNIVDIFLGVFLSLITFIIYDLSHNLTMIKNVILWVPYRIAGFLGLYPKNTVSVKVIEENISSFKKYLTQSFIAYDSLIIENLVLLFFVGIIIWLINKLRVKKLKYNYLFIVLWLLWGYIAVFIHGSPPIHYFVPILPAAILIFSLALDLLAKNKFLSVTVYFILIIITILNLSYYFSANWFYKDNTNISMKPYYLPYELQDKTAMLISNDARGRPFSLARIGLDDQFEQDYAQNYIYLLWLYGNEPVKEASRKYLIVEPGNDNRYNIGNGVMISDDEIKVIKYID